MSCLVGRFAESRIHLRPFQLHSIFAASIPAKAALISPPKKEYRWFVEFDCCHGSAHNPPLRLPPKAKEQPAGKGPAERQLKLNANGTAAKKANFFAFLGWTVPLGAAATQTNSSSSRRTKFSACWVGLICCSAQPLWNAAKERLLIACSARKRRAFLSYTSKSRVD